MSYTLFNTIEIYNLIIEIYFKKGNKCLSSQINTRWLFEKLLKQKYKIKKNGKFNTIYDFGENKLNVFIRRDNSDANVFEQVLVIKEYEALYKYILSKNEEISNIIDCGANIGLTTLYLKSKFPEAKIVSVEPDKDNVFLIKKNISINHFDNINIENAGIWSKETKLQLLADFRDGKSWALSVKEAHNEIGNVSGVTLDYLIKKYSMDAIDILKIDIEGAERHLFSEHKIYDKFLPKVKFLAIEIHDEFDIRNDIYRILIEYGFDYFESGELTIAFKKIKK